MSDVVISFFYDLLLILLSILVLVFGFILFILCKNKKVEVEEFEEEGEKEEETRPVAKHSASSYSFTEIDTATDGFNPRRVIGRGWIGTVYAAEIPKGEVMMAVKRIHSRLVLSDAGFGFSSIIKRLSVADHPNVLPIKGFSEAPGERLLMMEYDGMMSLEFYLHHQTLDGATLLDWPQRLGIAAGAARGLEYLHESMSPATIHGCLKPSNILIDVKFCSKISDYGLHFLAPNQKEGLLGYVDDEYWSGNKLGVSKECDVYGFGVVLLELLSGRKSENGRLVQWGLPLIKGSRFDEFFDPRVEIRCAREHEQMVRVARVAVACVGNCRKDRPSSAQVAAILSNLDVRLGVGRGRV